MLFDDESEELDRTLRLLKLRRNINSFKKPHNKFTFINNNTEEERMETKSRYEVIADLERKKGDLIREREGFADTLKEKEKNITYMERELADNKEDLDDFKERIDDRKEVIKELISGVEQSLERFAKLQTKKEESKA